MQPAAPRRAGDHVLAAIAATVTIQAIAAVFFLADAISDLADTDDGKGMLHNGLELLVAVALAAGVVTGVWLYRRMLFEARQRDAVVQVARGALSDLLTVRFAEWRLTAAEREVATFALKGCDVAEIAALRGAAPSTVRAQLSRIYGKAGVSGQSMLIGLVVDELLDLAPQLETVAAGP